MPNTEKKVETKTFAKHLCRIVLCLGLVTLLNFIPVKSAFAWCPDGEKQCADGCTAYWGSLAPGPGLISQINAYCSAGHGGGGPVNCMATPNWCADYGSGCPSGQTWDSATMTCHGPTGVPGTCSNGKLYDPAPPNGQPGFNGCSDCSYVGTPSVTQYYTCNVGPCPAPATPTTDAQLKADLTASIVANGKNPADYIINVAQEMGYCPSGGCDGNYPRNLSTAYACSVSSTALCGPAHNANLSTAPSAPADLCASGSPSSVTGSGPWSWTCTAGASVENCQSGACKNGLCNNSIQNACLWGTADDGLVADDSAFYRWACLGINGGSNDLSCAIAKPAVNGACDNSVVNSCPAGTLNDTADDSSNYLWNCDGINGGATAYCSQAKGVNGICDNSVVNGCIGGSGLAFDPSSDASNDYWKCHSPSSGADSGQCQKSKSCAPGPTTVAPLLVQWVYGYHATNNVCPAGYTSTHITDDITDGGRHSISEDEEDDAYTLCLKADAPGVTIDSVWTTVNGAPCPPGMLDTGLQDSGGDLTWHNFDEEDPDGYKIRWCVGITNTNGTATIETIRTVVTNDFNQLYADMQAGHSAGMSVIINSTGHAAPGFYDLLDNLGYSSFIRDDSACTAHAGPRGACSAWAQATSATPVGNKFIKDVSGLGTAAGWNVVSARGPLIIFIPPKCSGDWTPLFNGPGDLNDWDVNTEDNGDASLLCMKVSSASTSCSSPSPINGVCNNSVQNGCSAGMANDAAIPDTGTDYQWRCDGANGGTDSGVCSIPISFDPAAECGYAQYVGPQTSAGCAAAGGTVSSYNEWTCGPMIPITTTFCLKGGSSLGDICRSYCVGSDRRLKQDIVKVGSHPGFDGHPGFGIYEFTYRSDPQHHRYRGVMAQEVLDIPGAAIMGSDGYYRVNYSKVGVPFERLN